MNIPALKPGNVAVITGGASGIGLAAAHSFAAMGLHVCIADMDEKALALASDKTDFLALKCDVSSKADLVHLEKTVRERFGRVDVLMNNAGIQPGSAMFESRSPWEKIIAVNMWGVINGARQFAARMIEQGTPAMIINTGSKQGITTPPGDPAYNISKTAVKAFTEALQHELRSLPGCHVTAHLLIPGFVYTALTKKDRVEKPPGAWTPEQTVDFMLNSLETGDFYILCPDNDVARSLDEKRIAWAAGDIIENRPPLSRWHPDFDDKFKASLKRSKGDA